MIGVFWFSNTFLFRSLWASKLAIRIKYCSTVHNFSLSIMHARLYGHHLFWFFEGKVVCTFLWHSTCKTISFLFIKDYVLVYFRRSRFFLIIKWVSDILARLRLKILLKPTSNHFMVYVSQILNIYFYFTYCFQQWDWIFGI